MEKRSNKSNALRDQESRYVVDAQGQPVAVLLTIEGYEHYLDLLEDEADSMDEEIAARLNEAVSSPGMKRLSFREYLGQRRDVKSC